MTPATAYGERDCPLCGRPAPAAREVVARRPAETMPFEALVPYWNGFFKERVFFSYARCPACGLLYAPAYFDQEQLETLYAQMPPNMDVVPEAALRKTQRGYFKVLASHAPLTGGYLEVGPDVGLFTENCVRDGRFNTHWLYEPNRAVWPALEAATAGADRHIQAEISGFAKTPDASVGAAALIHVLDHLREPLERLGDLRRTLADGATVVIVTHDESSPLRRALGSRWPAFCLQHPLLYNRPSLNGLLKAAGYAPAGTWRTVNYFPVGFLAKQTLWAVGLRLDSAQAAGGPTVGLELGNILTLAHPQCARSL